MPQASTNSPQYKHFITTTTNLQGFPPERARQIERLRKDQGFVTKLPAGKHNSGIEASSQK
tara:strand:+ start:215 stop:397 length:183 start_codon:yes stop_codon:yes gene_type:complete